MILIGDIDCLHTGGSLPHFVTMTGVEGVIKRGEVIFIYNHIDYFPLCWLQINHCRPNMRSLVHMTSPRQLLTSFSHFLHFFHQFYNNLRRKPDNIGFVEERERAKAGMISLLPQAGLTPHTAAIGSK